MHARYQLLVYAGQYTSKYAGREYAGQEYAGLQL